jgi:hypothetical protein
MTEQRIEAFGELAPHDQPDLAAALRELKDKVDKHNDKQNEALMRLGYSTTTLSSAAADALSAAKFLGLERQKLAEIVARPAPLMRQRLYIAGALVAGVIIGLIAPMIIGWVSDFIAS